MKLFYALHRYGQVRLEHLNLVTIAHREVECLNVIAVRQEVFNFGSYEQIRQHCHYIVGVYLRTLPIQAKRVLNDLDSLSNVH